MTILEEQAQMTAVDKFTPENILPLLQTIADLVEKRCHRFLSRKYGLTMPQYQLLLAAVYGDATTLGSLADELNCSRGNLTGVADRLERDGWLVRERSTEDRRVVNIRLTDKGNKVWEIKRELAKELAEMAKIWSPDERTIMLRSLERLYGVLKAETARPGEESKSEAI
ncbi:MAG TPA: MarR family transcriptional regulator [Symbiobacteriaceae bacterium]|nr:MarR family transcriptional regulator [Symbiobacteriaceae bacterium]